MAESDSNIRCSWVGKKSHLVRYHDEEWGLPVHDDRKHFEMLLLEGAQAGLSWETILQSLGLLKSALMKDAGIIRNRLKIDATVTNAQAFLAVQQECSWAGQWSYMGLVSWWEEHSVISLFLNFQENAARVTV